MRSWLPEPKHCRTTTESAGGSSPWAGWRPLLIGLSCALFATSPLRASGSQAGDPPARPLTTGEIVRQLDAHNQERAQLLKGYRSIRDYHLVYTGFPHRLEASMEVEAIYQAPSTRTFHVLSQSGSTLLIDRVLKRLLATEEQAGRNPQQTALTPDNYNFTLLGNETVAGHDDYVLQVEPRVVQKLLYKGRIWVDPQDFAVQQIDVQPAQNPSLWILSTQIHHVYLEKDGFRFPEKDESISKLRFGGRAVLTIDYGEYQLQ
jgi:outer membrane lipoprotein-sorting protein